MPLTRQDCVDLVREIENLLREYDPDSLELLFRATEQFDEPLQHLISLLTAIRRVYSESSGGAHEAILDRINRFVRPEDGSHVRAISVELSPIERELYGREEFNLAELPDRSAFIEDLDRITAEIRRETAEEPQ